MRKALQALAVAISALTEDAQARCNNMKESPGVSDLLLASKNLAKGTAHNTTVVYKKMEKLTVSDMDIHKDLNKFIAGWKKESANATEVGDALGAMFKPLT